MDAAPSPPSAPALPHSELYEVPLSPRGPPLPPPAGAAEEERQREGEGFANYAEFLLTSVGYCVGLGNVVVFPGRVYNYGGGTFLVCYFIWLFVLGVPLYAHDLKVGQFYRRGAYGSFLAMSPRLWGVGAGHVVIAVLMIAYFNTIIGWALLYLYYSFSSPLPWAGNTRKFFYEDIVGASTGLGDVHGMNWPVFGANGAAWLVTCLVLIKGVQSGGKVVYVTVILPYVCIVALIVKGAMMPGGTDGIRAYLEVDVAKFADYETWARSATQIFYSMGVAMGAIVTFGSLQQKSNQNYHRDGAMIPIINSLTSFLGGFAIFPMLGYLSQSTGTPIDELDLSGFGITFVAYTEALASFPQGAAQAFSVVFFLMIVTLGIDTQIGVTESVITFVKELPVFKSWSGPWVTVFTCLVGFGLSLPCTTDAGYYYVTLLWDYGNFMSMFIVAGCSILGSAYLAGINWHHRASQELRGKGENPLLLFWWRSVCPILCFALFGVALVGLIPYPTSLGYFGPGTGGFPTWAQVVSGVLNFGPSLLVVIGVALPGCALPSAWSWCFKASSRASGSREIQLSPLTSIRRKASEQYGALRE